MWDSLVHYAGAQATVPDRKRTIPQFTPKKVAYEMFLLPCANKQSLIQVPMHQQISRIDKPLQRHKYQETATRQFITTILDIDINDPANRYTQ